MKKCKDKSFQTVENLIEVYIRCLDIWNHEDSIRLKKEPLKIFLLEILGIWKKDRKQKIMISKKCKKCDYLKVAKKENTVIYQCKDCGLILNESDKGRTINDM